MEIKFTNKYDINDILLMNTPLIKGILTGVAVLVSETDTKKLKTAYEMAIDAYIKSLENSRDEWKRRQQEEAQNDVTRDPPPKNPQ